MRFFRPLHRLIGKLHSLPRMFMSRLVILFLMVRSGCAMRMGGEFVELGGSLVRFTRHGDLPSISLGV